MKLKITISCAGDGFDYQPGQEVDVPQERAKDLLNAGYAEAVVEKKKAQTRITKTSDTRAE